MERPKSTNAKAHTISFEVVSSDNYQVLFLCPLNTPIIFKKPRLSDKI